MTETGFRSSSVSDPSLHHRDHGTRWFLCLLAVLWIFFYSVWLRFPYLRSGASIVYSAKDTQERRGVVFPADVPAASRLIVFGNSKVLTGFLPDLFDRQTGVYSANMGKPEESRFVSDLALLAARGQAPRDVVVTLPWATEAPPPDDSRVMDTLFPFRKLPRDLVLFGMLARERGGVPALYRYGENAVQSMQQNRGWYFIEGQSHYPGDRLPDSFHLGTDRPDVIDDPAFLPRGPEFERLNRLASRYSMRVFLVPSYHRIGELGPSPDYAASVARRMAGFPRFTVIGPNYFLLASRYFSDPVHLNPEGAAVYTTRLAGILAPAVSRPRE
ncbi:MAG TPA: hypothetical protein VG273_08510 [Bryobacteraceae bacterium]|nr:hypothetical protein [Bryobacteraceae bacterium]